MTCMKIGVPFETLHLSHLLPSASWVGSRGLKGRSLASHLGILELDVNATVEFFGSELATTLATLTLPKSFRSRDEQSRRVCNYS